MLDENEVGYVFFFLATWCGLVMTMKALEVCARSRVDAVSEGLIAQDTSHSQLRNATVFNFVCQTMNFVSLVYVTWLFDLGFQLLLFLTFDFFILAIRFGGSLARLAICWYKFFYNPTWEKCPHFLRITTLSFDLAVRCVQLSQWLQLWVLEGIHFSLVDVFIFSQMNGQYATIKQLWKRIRGLLHAYKTFEENLSHVPEEELKDDCSCPVCMDDMDVQTARKLKCGHVFHMDCIQRWLCTREGSRKCPVCRADIFPRNISSSQAHEASINSGETTERSTPSISAQNAPPIWNSRARPRAFFQFDSRRNGNANAGLFSWLVSGALSGLSIQIHSHEAGNSVERIGGLDPGEAVDRVLEVLPQANREQVRSDLNRSRSIEVTINNLLQRGIPEESHPAHSDNNVSESGNDNGQRIRQRIQRRNAGDEITTDPSNEGQSGELCEGNSASGDGQATNSHHNASSNISVHTTAPRSFIDDLEINGSNSLPRSRIHAFSEGSDVVSTSGVREGSSYQQQGVNSEKLIDGLDPEKAVDRVREMFPQANREEIRTDLNRTKSIEVTINNFIQRNVTVNSQASAGNDVVDNHNNR